MADSWLVLHKQSRKVNDINTDIYWFYGKESRLFARYLSFAVAGTFSTENWIPAVPIKGRYAFTTARVHAGVHCSGSPYSRKKTLCRRAALT